MLEKIKKTAKRHDNIIITIIFFIITIGPSLYVSTVNSDETWAFQHLYKMYNGYKIYIDANVITTPLYWYIGLFLFKIFGANFFILRIYHEAIVILIMLTTYKTFRVLKIDKTKSLLLTLILYTLSARLFLQASYNSLVLLFCLIGILNLLKENKKNQAFIQGIILFLIAVTKQNIGIFYGIGLLIYEITSKKEINEKIKNLLKYVLINLIGFSILAIILKTTGTLEGFINYAILGIKEFSQENISILTIYFFINILIITLAIILSAIALKYLKIKQKEKTKIKVLLIFSITMFPVMFPIVNWVHASIAIYSSYILLIYLVLEIISKEIIEDLLGKKLSKMLKIITITIIILLFIISAQRLIIWFNKEKNIKYTNPYFGGIVAEDKKEQIKKVNEYIKNSEKKTIIISGNAALYNIPEKRNNGVFDLPFKGNLGKEGEEGLIEEIKKLKDTKILIKENLEEKEKHLLWQESEKAKEYIKNNFEKIGEIEEFSIYETK